MTSFDSTFTSDNNNNSLRKKIVVGAALALLLGVATYSSNGATKSPGRVRLNLLRSNQGTVSDTEVGIAVGVNGAYIGLAGGVNGKSSNSRKSKSKSDPALPVDLPPKCEDVGDPVYGPSNPIPQPVLPSELVRTMTLSPPPGEIVIDDTEGVVDIELVKPCFMPNTAYPDDAVWCAEGHQQFRITAHTTCLQSITDEYYWIQYVKTEFDFPAGSCTLLRVSRQAPGTWQEYQTPAMANHTAGAAIEWTYDTKPVDKRYKFSLCPNPEDKDMVKKTRATFIV